MDKEALSLRLLPVSDQDPANDNKLLVGRNWPGTSQFGRLLRVARVTADMSAEEVADAAGVTAPFLRAVERGDRAPSKDTAIALLRGLAIEHHEVAPGRRLRGGPDLVLHDPRDGKRVWVEFKATHKGDSLSWALTSTTPGPGEDDASAWRPQEGTGPGAETERRLLALEAHLPHAGRTEQSAPEPVGRYTSGEDEGPSSADRLIADIVRQLPTADERTLGMVERLLRSAASHKDEEAPQQRRSKVPPPPSRRRRTPSEPSDP